MRAAVLAWLCAVSLLPGVASSAPPEPVPKRESAASRVLRVKFVPHDVTRLRGAIDHPVLVEFSADEPIEDVAGGGISGWEVQKRAHRLFVRAMPQARAGTMLITTRSRSYVFDLVPVRAAAKGALGPYMSKIVFEYDALPPAAPVAAASTPPDKAIPAKLEDLPLERDSPPPYRNASYSMQVVSETVDIRPREAFDDGRFTWLLFPRNQELPVVYKSVPGTQEEMVVNSHMEGEYLVLHAVAPLWNLRLAGSVVGVFNDAYDAMGVGAGTKTVFPHVQRVDKR